MMKYTWRVAQEVMRFYPPIFGNFRLTRRDISFDGFYIPKGWQVKINQLAIVVSFKCIKIHKQPIF